MEKVVRVLALTLLVLGAAGIANAGWTTNVYNTSVSSPVALNKTFTWPPYHQLTSWDHEWVVPSGGDIVSATVTSAALAIESQYTNGKVESVRLDSNANPSLANLNDGWTAVPFTLADYLAALDGDVTVYTTVFDAVTTGAQGQVILKNSKLDLTYEVTEKVWVDDPIPPAPVVPAPAALLLGGLGTGLVGWLRRRGTV